MKIKQENKTGSFLSMLLGTLGASLIGNTSGKAVIAKSQEQALIRTRKAVIRQDFQCCHILWLVLKYIIEINPNLMLFIQKTNWVISNVYNEWEIRNEAWWT